MATCLKCSMLIVLLVVTSNSGLHVSAKSALYTNESLRTGEQLTNHNFRLVMQTDCNLVLYDSNKPVWSTGTALKGSTCHVTMQSDGNLVIYGEQGAIWASKTVRGNDNYEFILQDDRNLVIYKGPARKPIWASKSAY